MTDPLDDTQPHAGDPPAGSPAGDPPAPAPPSGPVPPAPGSEPPLRADPDRPADSGWREPAWFPPRDRSRGRDGRPSMIAIVIGLILIAIGAWYFIDRTLGVTMPRIQWSSIWPVILIVLGGLILLRSFQRKG